MTLAVTIMIGAGILLVISAIENSSLVATFQAIWGRKPLSSLATGSTGSTGSTNAAGNAKASTKKS